MAFLEDAKKSLVEDSIFFSGAEPLKIYKFQLLDARKLNEKDNLYESNSVKWEFKLLDVEMNKEKIWTTGGGAVKDMVEQEIKEGSIFTVMKTGNTGKGKKYWEIKKVSDGETGEGKVSVEDEFNPPIE